MSTVEHPLQALDKYLPPNTFLPVAAYLQKYKVHLTVSRERKTILGNYRNAYNNHSHRISVNGNLNTFSFLITLLHELAHLLTYEQYRNKVQPHGREWKTLYGQLLAQFIENKVFPADIESELLATLHNPGASSCSEEGLVRILRNYDPQKDNYFPAINRYVFFSLKGITSKSEIDSLKLSVSIPFSSEQLVIPIIDGKPFGKNGKSRLKKLRLTQLICMPL